jgi:hypothetical protein
VAALANAGQEYQPETAGADDDCRPVSASEFFSAPKVVTPEQATGGAAFGRKVAMSNSNAMRDEIRQNLPPFGEDAEMRWRGELLAALAACGAQLTWMRADGRQS